MQWRRLASACSSVRSLLIRETFGRRLGLAHGDALRLTTTRRVRLPESRGWQWLTWLHLPSPDRGGATSSANPTLIGGLRRASGILIVMTGYRWLLMASHTVSTVTLSRSTLGSSSCCGTIAESSPGVVGWTMNEN